MPEQLTGEHEVNILITATMREVRYELRHAVDKHTIERTPLNPDMDVRDVYLCIAEEVGELAHELTYDAVGTVAERIINAEKEAIQVAAMAIAFVVGSRRRGLVRD